MHQVFGMQLLMLSCGLYLNCRHPFDASKWGRIKKFLADDGVLSPKCIVEPVEATKDDLLVVQ